MINTRINKVMNSDTDKSIAHAELLLVNCLKKKILSGIKTSSCQCIFCKVPVTSRASKLNQNLSCVEETLVGGL
jgi:hypothetical protein